MFVSPEEMHTRAQTNGKSDTLDVVIQTVNKFLENSQGKHRAKCLLCGIHTTEYCIVPIPSTLVLEAKEVKQMLMQDDYFVVLREDSLMRFSEEVIMVICWDPNVIKSYHTYIDSQDAEDHDIETHNITCIIPGREDKACNKCFFCYNDDKIFQ